MAQTINHIIAGLAHCSICNRDFPLITENHYIARDVEKVGIICSIQGQDEPVLYDAFDCPHCGCQQIIAERKRFYFSDDETCDIEEEEDK